jgi:ABC-type transport system substrate-binding protein
LVVLLLLALLTLSACHKGNSDGDKLTGANAAQSVYRHSMDSAPTDLDPAHASNIYANFLVVNLYDTLYRYKYLARPYQLEPNLAEALPQVSADGLRYSIRIKPGVYFIDDEAFPGGKGRELTAGDFVYSIKRHFDPATRSQAAWIWQNRIAGLDEWIRNGARYDMEVSGLRALDDYTIEFRLNAPFPQLTHTLAQGFSAIVPIEAVEKYGRELSIHPVGSGPFRLQRFDSAGASLLRNAGFRAEPLNLAAEGYDPSTQAAYGLERLQGLTPPLADRIDIEFIAEDAARWNTFLSGQLDFVKVPVSQFERVLKSRNPPLLADDLAANYHLLASLESGFVHTDFNMADARIGYLPDGQADARNHALRCAIIRGFDWDKRNEIFYSDIGRVFPGIIPPSALEYDADQDTDSIRRNVVAANRLLSESGWNAENLPVLEYGFVNSVTERQMFEQFRSFLADINYPAEKIHPLIFASYGDYSRAFLNREVMLATSSWVMDYPDTANIMQLFFGPNASPGANSANYDNAEFNRLFRASSTMGPSPVRTDMFRKMNQILINDCVTISGISRTLVLLWNRRVAMLPDREFVGGFFFRFASPDVAQDAAAQGSTSRTGSR